MRNAIEDISSLRQLDVISYPRRDPDEARKRLKRLRELGVTHVEFTGRTEINGVKILGKGTTSIVLKVYVKEKPLAAKILRLDANRESVSPEAERVAMANRLGIGPKLIGHTDEVLLLELLEGKNILEALGEVLALPPEERRETLKDLIREILTQCFELDRIALDHGQLSRPDKHLYVTPDGRVKIIDFETSSTSRRPSNLTSILQFLLVSGLHSGRVRDVLGVKSLDEIFPHLKRYKKNPNVEMFGQILKILNIH